MKIDYKDCNTITIMGLGLYSEGSGIEAVKYFLLQNKKLIITDLRTKKILQAQIKAIQIFIQKNKLKNSISFILGKHRKRDFQKKYTDMIIKNPAVHPNSKYLIEARKNNMPILTDTAIFFNQCLCPIIGITGTRGKSTTTQLLYEIVKKSMQPAILGGNIMKSPLKYLPKITKNHLAILELPAQQLHELSKLKKSPHISVLTNILPDHYNFYGSKQKYIHDKKYIFQYQKSADYAIVNYDNVEAKKIGLENKAQQYWFSLKKLQKNKNGAFVHNQTIYFRNNNHEEGVHEEGVVKIKKIRMQGTHNLSNILAAICASKILKISNKTIQSVLRSFQGLPFRMQLVKQKNGVRYYNDSTATTPDATIAALNTLSRQSPKIPIILICGGMAKVPNYLPLVRSLYLFVHTLILIPGSASIKIKKIISASWKHSVLSCHDLKTAVQQANKISCDKKIILFSPAAASFNQFDNEIDRAKKFNQYINETAPKGQHA